MEVSQFTYFQQVAGFECAPVAGELTYGLERLAMYVQGVDRVYDLNFNGRDGADKVTYGDVFLQAEQEYSRHNFEHADTDDAVRAVQDGGGGLQEISRRRLGAGQERRHLMALPAYDQCIKASHVFNLLDARGVISVTERQSYILRVRELAKACGEAWLATEGEGHDMSATPEIGGRKPIVDQRRGRQELLVVRLRALQDAAVLRRLAQGHGVRADRVEGDDDRRGLVLHLQAHHDAAAVRRQSQEAAP